MLLEEKIKKIKKCYKIFQENNILSNDPNEFKKKFRAFALKNHPDKGGDSKQFGIINDCKDIFTKDIDYFIEIATRPTQPQPRPTPTQPIIITRKEFKKKSCNEKKQGWDLKQLKLFCNQLNISDNGSKVEVCERLNKYFDNILRKEEKRKEEKRKEKKRKEEKRKEEIEKKERESKLKEMIKRMEQLNKEDKEYKLRKIEIEKKEREIKQKIEQERQRLSKEQQLKKRKIDHDDTEHISKKLKLFHIYTNKSYYENLFNHMAYRSQNNIDMDD